MDIRGWIILWLGAGRFPGHPKMFNSNCDLYTLDVSGDKHGCLQTLPTGRKNHPRLRTASLWSQRMLESDIVLRAGALGWPWGMGWWGRWERSSGWGTHVPPWLIHVNVWQKPLQYCKVISLQLKKKVSNTTVRKHQFFGAQLFYIPTLTSVRDYWKDHSFD